MRSNRCTGAPAAAGRRARGLAALLAALALAAPACANASAGSGLVVIPRPAGERGLSYFKLSVSPGSTAAAGAIELRNPTSAPVTVSLSEVDGRTLSTLGSGYAPPGSPRHGATRWLHLAMRSVLLPAASAVTVPVAVTVPSAAAPGDYLSGISAEAQGQDRSGLAAHGVSVASVERYVLGVEVSVPGPRTARIELTGAGVTSEPGGVAFMLSARNAGNTIVPGVHGHVSVTLGSRTVLSRPIEAGTFVTGPEISYPVPALGETPAEGTRYRVAAWLTYPGGVTRLDSGVTFGERAARTGRSYGRDPVGAVSSPTAWWKLGLLAAVILYATFTTALLLRRRGREGRGEPGL